MTPSSIEELVVRLVASLDWELLAVLGESKADVLIESTVSLFLRFGERDKSDVIDFVGLEGNEARALGTEGLALSKMMLRSWEFEVRYAGRLAGA